MKGSNLQLLLAHCDRLTADGQQLAVTWEGGGDEGWFCMRYNGMDVDRPDEIQQAIIDFVAEHVGYGSFAGEFSTDGLLDYDREQKSFIGQDRYAESISKEHECNIVLWVPEGIWFDRLSINVQNEGLDISAVMVLEIKNGPHPDQFDAISDQLEQSVAKEFMDVIENIDDFEEIWQMTSIKHDQFSIEDGKLVHIIKSIMYSSCNQTTTEIAIPLY